MMPSSLSKLSFFSLCWALRVTAQTLDVGVSGTAYGEGAVGVERAEDYTAWQTYNASHSLTLPGPNITRSRGDSPPVDWELLLTIHPDIPFPDPEYVPSSDPEATRGKFFTGTQITLLAPDDVRKLPANASSISPDYDICMGIPFAVKVNGDVDAGGDGSCEGLVSDECLRALQATASLSVCNNISLPPVACQDEDNELDIGISFNSSARDQTNRVYIHRRSESEDIHDKGDTSIYDEVIRRAFVVYTYMGPQVAENSTSTPDMPVYGNVSCLRVNEFVDESRDFEDDARSLTVLVAWPTFAALSAIVFTLL